MDNLKSTVMTAATAERAEHLSGINSGVGGWILDSWKGFQILSVLLCPLMEDTLVCVWALGLQRVLKLPKVRSGQMLGSRSRAP